MCIYLFCLMRLDACYVAHLTAGHVSQLWIMNKNAKMTLTRRWVASFKFTLIGTRHCYLLSWKQWGFESIIVFWIELSSFPTIWINSCVRLCRQIATDWTATLRRNGEASWKNKKLIPHQWRANLHVCVFSALYTYELFFWSFILEFVFVTCMLACVIRMWRSPDGGALLDNGIIFVT